jgi:hypothetical protein
MFDLPPSTVAFFETVRAQPIHVGPIGPISLLPTGTDSCTCFPQACTGASVKKDKDDKAQERADRRTARQERRAERSVIRGIWRGFDRDTRRILRSLGWGLDRIFEANGVGRRYRGSSGLAPAASDAWADAPRTMARIYDLTDRATSRIAFEVPFDELDRAPSRVESEQTPLPDSAPVRPDSGSGSRGESPATASQAKWYVPATPSGNELTIGSDGVSYRNKYFDHPTDGRLRVSAPLFGALELPVPDGFDLPLEIVEKTVQVGTLALDAWIAKKAWTWKGGGEARKLMNASALGKAYAHWKVLKQSSIATWAGRGIVALLEFRKGAMNMNLMMLPFVPICDGACAAANPGDRAAEKALSEASGSDPDLDQDEEPDLDHDEDPDHNQSE